MQEKKELILNVKQRQKVDLHNEYPQVEFFQGKVEVEIDGHITEVWLEPKAENIFSFSSSQLPKLVHFDYESTWIRESNNALDDVSDRVINTAATALGKSKNPKAFAALAKLVNKPSWKNQSLISALNGLKQLGDPRGFDIAFKVFSDPYLLRWRLPTPPFWDFRVFAAETIATL